MPTKPPESPERDPKAAVPSSAKATAAPAAREAGSAGVVRAVGRNAIGSLDGKRNYAVVADAEEIRVRGARVHNLKNVDFVIPHNAITVMSGVSGSGKSSLAFDTLYAEGQRRYIESL